ncbi:hypothetical protein, partial [Methylocaldum sp.]|uniref:hypothetical protein n=1 Tax=Methylocaldum sp. TaxID=1969727 RepID=UPI002D381D0F
MLMKSIPAFHSPPPCGSPLRAAAPCKSAILPICHPDGRATARPISLLAKWSCTPLYTPVITRPILGLALRASLRLFPSRILRAGSPFRALSRHRS